ncbi:MAG: glycosyltransferase [Chitinophagaceae bacterium]
MCTYQVTASIVLYNSDDTVYKTIESFLRINALKIFLYLIDNSPSNNFEKQNAQLLSKDNIQYIFTGKNVGYGAGHNIALGQSLTQSEYHLVLNPDVYFEEGVVETLYQYASKHSTVGHIMPKTLYPNGEIQYACKLIPSPLDLIARLLPAAIFKKSNEKFELKFTGYNKIMEVPYLHGCFMFFRCAALQQIGLFDERFFMYPEDIDITRRMHKKFKTIYYPFVHVFHKHAKSSFKNKRMFFIHIQNIIRYFNKWGWFFDSERKKINTAIIKQFEQKQK